MGRASNRTQANTVSGFDAAFGARRGLAPGQKATRTDETDATGYEWECYRLAEELETHNTKQVVDPLDPVLEKALSRGLQLLAGADFGGTPAAGTLAREIATALSDWCEDQVFPRAWTDLRQLTGQQRMDSDAVIQELNTSFRRALPKKIESWLANATVVDLAEARRQAEIEYWKLSAQMAAPLLTFSEESSEKHLLAVLGQEKHTELRRVLGGRLHRADLGKLATEEVWRESILNWGLYGAPLEDNLRLTLANHQK